MGMKLNYGFTINIAKPVKVKRESKSYTVVGAKCTAIVIKDGDTLKARLDSSPVKEEDAPQTNFTVLSFTPDSFDLKGKTTIFAKHRDKYGHRIMIIRDYYKTLLSPGVKGTYDVLQEGLKIEGHIVTKSGIKYFRYENLLAATEEGMEIGEILTI